MPAALVSFAKLLGSTMMAVFTSILTGPMIEWAFWWLAEKMVKSTDDTWDNELLERMKKERQAVKESK